MNQLRRSRSAFLVALVSLIGAIAACIGSSPAPSNQDPVVGDFTTATPGGSISVWLLTPQTALPGQGGEPIGPVATATAAAALAATETAIAVEPSPTSEGVVNEAARCPEAGTPNLPVNPPPFSQFATTIVEYLSAGGAPSILEASLRNWGALNDRGGLVRSDRDFTADGVPEVFVVALDPERSDSNPQPGDMFIYTCDDGAYRLIFQAGYAIDRGAPVIISADDLNGDLQNDMVYSTISCDVRACFLAVQAITWQSSLSSFDRLIREDVEVPNAEVFVGSVDEDPLQEIVMVSGQIESVQAGPQRPMTTTWKWDGEQFVVARIDVADPEYRVHALHDADDAFNVGGYQEAILRYEDVIRNEDYLSWTYFNETIFLRAYAIFRIMLAQSASGDLAAAETTYSFMQGQYESQPLPTTTPSEGTPAVTPTPTATPLVGPIDGFSFWQMADLFWNDFSINRDLPRACSLVVNFARSNPGSFEVLNSFGYSNREYVARDLCPFE
ncbi:MAG: hypothetical protein GYB68_14615 [Chloroflexi bacterium]|nr:hypothetical protein [Chloroflexota bacterium]